MAKISNTTVYPTVTPADDDLLILTDATDSNRTKTVKMSGVKSYLNVDTFTATGTVTLNKPYQATTVDVWESNPTKPVILDLTLDVIDNISDLATFLPS